MGTTGRSAVVPNDIPQAISTKHIATITLNRQLAHPEFVSNALHRHPQVLRQIQESNRGAIMAGLNLTIIKNLELPIPPLETQLRFASSLARVRAVQDNAAVSLGDADSLFGALSHRAFRGELLIKELTDAHPAHS